MSKKLNEYTKEELLAYVRQLQKDTTFGLVWNPKQENIVAECETKVPVLQEVADKAIAKVSESEPTHLLIEGDNYHSLSVLNYTHAEKIDVIYIDPPYNTGNKEFIYNDRRVSKDDPYRHSEWLSFMDNRLRLAKNLLTDAGVVFISIDDNEQAHLRILCDKIYGEDNFIGNFIWRKKSGGGQTDDYFVIEHEYILVYRKTKKFTWINDYTQVDVKAVGSDEHGDFAITKLEKWGNGSRREDRPSMYFPINDPDGNEFYPVAPDGNDGRWRVGLSRMNDLIENDGIFWKKNKDRWTPYEKNYTTGSKNKLNKTRSILYELAETGHGTKLLTDIFGQKDLFPNPKPVELLEFLLKHTKKSSIVLDFFAGSGSTGHAVLRLNQNDGGKRQFILSTNNESGIAENITYKRISKVVDGYSSTVGIPANVRYFKTQFVETHGISHLTDSDKLEITKEMGAMIALRENSFEQVEQTSHWQTYENTTQVTAIYYREDKTKIDEYIDKLNAQDKPVKLYVFGWGKNAGTEYSSDKISVEDIPEPLIEVYKEIAK